MRAFRRLALAGLCFLTGWTAIACNPAQPGGSDSAGKALVANLRGADGAQADVEFVEKDGHTEFVLAVSGGEPGGSVEVTINGVVVLSIQLDDFGNARVAFDSDPDELDEDALPATFPGADGGDSVGVGGLSGHFEDNDNENGNVGDHGDDDDEGGDDDADEIELEARLAATDSSLQAKVKFESEGEKRELEVRVRGGAPGSTLDFSVGGVTLATLTLDDYGTAKLEFDSGVDDGELPFPADFVAPIAGTAVAVGPLSGAFAAESDDDGEDDDNADDHSDDGDDDDDNVNDNGGDDDNANANDNADDSSNVNDNVDDDNINANDNEADSEEDNVNDNGP